MYRIGFGYDVHRLKTRRKLWIGGTLIKSPKGAVGHSDADVLLHAICDALLGAANLGDIGTHFPDTAKKYKNIASAILLKQVGKMIIISGYHIGNVDSTVCLESPKIIAYIPSMKIVIAKALSIDVAAISVKATTNEKMGFVGKGEGIAAYAVALLQQID